MSFIPTGGGVPTGTAFPANPTAGQILFRSDLGLEFFFDGTRWLTTTLFQTDSFNIGGITSAFTNSFFQSLAFTLDVFFTTIWSSAMVVAPNTGAAFWTINISKLNAANVGTLIAALTTQNLAAGQWNPISQVLNTVLINATFKQLVFDLAKTGAPGAISAGVTVEYRLIGT